MSEPFAILEDNGEETLGGHLTDRTLLVDNTLCIKGIELGADTFKLVDGGTFKFEPVDEIFEAFEARLKVALEDALEDES